jgi:aspartyl-tRNA(Asn)/glutamyl-tRNA(Gln) amidotransferase subunit B
MHTSRQESRHLARFWQNRKETGKMKQYETVIGLEVHVELATKTKIFCGCSTEFGGAPNTHTCPVCTGMPGSLPVLNKQVVEYAIAVGLATNCSITQYCKFDRKNYFYPDNPQNYQISQLYLPICRNGGIEIETAAGKKTVGIHEIHMEEDAGKLVHDDWTGSSMVDYNRSGVPLIEIVSEPDMRSADEVIAYLEKLRMIIQYLGASDCKLQEGSMRADVNLSVREVGATEFGTRTEMKNLNSFKAISHAIEGERARQIELLEEGRQVIQETRRWDDNKESSYAMRSKEDAQDYRYFPEPDLVPIVISDEWLKEVKDRQPELRSEKLERYKKEYDIPEYDAEIITGTKKMADIFEATTAICNKPKKVSNWLMVETMRLLKENEMEAEDISFAPENLAKLIELADAGEINSSVAKEVFEEVFKNNVDPEKYVEEKGLKTVSDDGALREVIEKVVADNPKSVEDYNSGKKKAIGFLVGQTMKAMQGKADPGMVNKILKEVLG